MLRAKGLTTFPNYLSAVPEGSLSEASNIVIDRDGIIEPRRGFKVYSELSSKAKQLLNYRDNLLVHSGDTLAFTSDIDTPNLTTFKTRIDFQPTAVDVLNNTIQIPLHKLQANDAIFFINTGGTLPAPLVDSTIYYVKNPTQNTFQLKISLDSPLTLNITSQGTGLNTAIFDTVVDAVSEEQRIKAIEQNGNLYITTKDGVKKVSELSEYNISSAGGIAALDLNLSIDFTTTVGFLNSQSEVSYRVTWITTDINNNLIEGSPSYRATIYNSSDNSRDVVVQFIVPNSITTDYSYRLYRTTQTVLGGSGDEQRLVYESKFDPTDSVYNSTTRTITLTDQQPESLRETGTNLYSNQISGDGISQTNDKPPIAVDISTYKNITFYANTITNHKLQTHLLGQDGLGHITPNSFSVAYSAPNTIFTIPSGFIVANQDIVLAGSTMDGTYLSTYISPTQFSLVGDFSSIDITKTSIFTSYITINKNSIDNKYYFVGRAAIDTMQVLTTGTSVEGKYFTINNHDNVSPYYVWFNDINAVVPSTDPNITSKIGLRVDYEATIPSAEVSVSVGTPAKVQYINHSFIDNDAVNFTVGTLPTGLSLLTTYYVKNSTINDFELSLTIGGASINTTGSPSVGARIAKVVYALTTTKELGDKIVEILTNTGEFRPESDGAVQPTITLTRANSGTSNVVGVGTLGTWTFNATQSQTGFGENSTNNYVRLSSLLSPAGRIEDTAKSLASVINRNLNEAVFASYISLIDELPGKILLENKNVDNISFSIIANNSFTGAMFNSNLSSLQSSLSESFPNRIYFSKYSQPEAVPSVNNIDIGPKNKKILRILGLRDSLFILKEEGIYRLTGSDITNFQVLLFDSSANIIAPDSANILNNQIYALTSQGVVTISENGVSIISRPIENIFNRITSPAYINYKTATFGFGYEGDRSYLLFTVEAKDDVVATICYRYNTFTQSWTSWDVTATAGIVESRINKIFLGAGDINAVEIERKDISSRDYVDREYSKIVSTYSNGFLLTDVNNIRVGDAVAQVQYLSYVDYNRLVNKLKLDPSIQLNASFPEITSPGANIRATMESIVNQMNLLDGSLITLNITDADVDHTMDVFNIASHGLLNGDRVKLFGLNLPAPLIENIYYEVINKTTNSFQLKDITSGLLINLTSNGAGAITIKELYYSSGDEDFSANQVDYNYNIAKLNSSTGVFFNNYSLSEGTYEIGFLVESISYANNKVNGRALPNIFQGPVTHYKSINSSVVWSHNSLGEPSILKHVRSGTFMVENYILSGAIVGYASDLSGNFEDIPFVLNGDGNWGESVFGAVTWGGDGVAVPLRTLVPRQKAYCRTMRARFKHINAFQKYSILGISFTFEPVSERSYR
jgi:hypothetical protein